jgi:hypothetical protein
VVQLRLRHARRIMTRDPDVETSLTDALFNDHPYLQTNEDHSASTFASVVPSKRGNERPAGNIYSAISNAPDVGRKRITSQ